MECRLGVCGWEGLLCRGQRLVRRLQHHLPQRYSSAVCQHLGAWPAGCGINEPHCRHASPGARPAQAVHLPPTPSLLPCRACPSSPRGDDLDTRLLRAMVVKGMLEQITTSTVRCAGRAGQGRVEGVLLVSAPGGRAGGAAALLRCQEALSGCLHWLGPLACGVPPAAAAEQPGDCCLAVLPCQHTNLCYDCCCPLRCRRSTW